MSINQDPKSLEFKDLIFHHAQLHVALVLQFKGIKALLFLSKASFLRRSS